MDRAIAESRHGVRRHHAGRPARGVATAGRRAAATGIDVAVIGSGVRRSKLLLPGALFAELPGAEVVPGLAR